MKFTDMQGAISSLSGVKNCEVIDVQQHYTAHPLWSLDLSSSLLLNNPGTIMGPWTCYMQLVLEQPSRVQPLGILITPSVGSFFARHEGQTETVMQVTIHQIDGNALVTTPHIAGNI